MSFITDAGVDTFHAIDCLESMIDHLSFTRFSCLLSAYLLIVRVASGSHTLESTQKATHQQDEQKKI